MNSRSNSMVSGITYEDSSSQGLSKSIMAGLVVVFIIIGLIVWGFVSLFNNDNNQELSEEEEQEEQENGELDSRPAVPLFLDMFDDIANLAELTPENRGVFDINIPLHSGFRMVASVLSSKLSNSKILKINENIHIKLHNSGKVMVIINDVSYELSIEPEFNNIKLELYKNKPGVLFTNNRNESVALPQITGNNFQVNVYEYPNIEFTSLFYDKL